MKTLWKNRKMVLLYDILNTMKNALIKMIIYKVFVYLVNLVCGGVRAGVCVCVCLCKKTPQILHDFP